MPRKKPDIKSLYYITQGITSLAMPALGCGLGNLEWREVGPLMCGILAELDIPVVVYLPREREIPAEFLKPEYLVPSALAKRTNVR